MGRAKQAAWMTWSENMRICGISLQQIRSLFVRTPRHDRKCRRNCPTPGPAREDQSRRRHFSFRAARGHGELKISEVLLKAHLGLRVDFVAEDERCQKRSPNGEVNHRAESRHAQVERIGMVVPGDRFRMDPA